MISEITTHLWQSTWFAVAAALLTLLFRSNRAQVRHWLWFSASMKFLIPLAVLMKVGSYFAWTPVARKIATPAVAFAVEYVSGPFTSQPSVGTPPPVPVDWRPIAIVALWLAGLIAISSLRLRNWLRIRAAVHASVPLQLEGVETRVAPGLLEPGVVGWLRPVLLLPEGIADSLTPQQLETVLAHEMCHVRRRDNLLASIHMIVEAVFWFHPLVWWVGARLLAERERACDEEVLRLGNQPRVYADAILGVCKLYMESPLVCVAGVTGSDIRKRIEAIMLNRGVRGLSIAKRALLAFAGLVAVAGPLAVGVVLGVGHSPAILAQAPAALIQPLMQLA